MDGRSDYWVDIYLHPVQLSRDDLGITAWISTYTDKSARSPPVVSQ